MKKLVLLLAVVASATLFSCSGNKAENAETTAAEQTEVVDTPAAETTVAETTAAQA